MMSSDENEKRRWRDDQSVICAATMLTRVAMTDVVTRHYDNAMPADPMILIYALMR